MDNVDQIVEEIFEKCGYNDVVLPDKGKDENGFPIMPQEFYNLLRDAELMRVNYNYVSRRGADYSWHSYYNQDVS